MVCSEKRLYSDSGTPFADLDTLTLTIASTDSGASSGESCANCHRAASPDVSLRECASCHTVKYCSRGCQRADWKAHKKSCGFTPTGNASRSGTQAGRDPLHFTTLPSPDPRGLHQTGAFNSIRDMMFGGTMGSMLEGKPEEEVYELMIDSHRMRMEDECNFQGKFQGLYGGEDPVPGFRQFLDKAETKQGLLPA